MEIKIKAQRRKETGKGPARRLRSAGFIPAVLYGRDIDTQSLKVDRVALRDILRGAASRNVLVGLTVEGDGDSEEHLTMIKEIQRHPFRSKILHVDFLKVMREEKIKVMVPVELIGESIGVKEGGVLQQNLWEVEVECLPGDVPERLELDISELDVGDHLVAADLPRVKGAEVLNDPEDVMVSVLAPRAEEEIVEEEEELVAEEGLVEEELAEEGVEEEEAEEGAAEETEE